MRDRVQWTGWASIALGAGVAANAIAGPLVLNVIRPRVSSASINQLLGGELVSLLIAAPLALVGGILLLRSQRGAPMLAIGPGLYAVYTYTQFAVGPQYERYPGNSEFFFLFHVALVVLGWLVTLGAWMRLRQEPAPALPAPLRRATGVLLLFVNGMFALAWLASIANVLDGSATAEYELDQTLFWLVRLMDLGFVIPIGIMIGVGLIRNHSWAERATQAFAGVQTLLACAVTGMGIVMMLKGDPATNRGLLVLTSFVSAALILIFWRLMRAVSSDSTRGDDIPMRRAAQLSGFS